MQVNELFRQSNTILLDGGMGTMLQAAGLKLGARPEELNITDPALIEGIHGQYAAAGSRIVNANTFGASAHKLAGSAYTLEQVITAGIENCKRACAPYGALTALDVGPLGELLEPSGTLAFEDAVAEYARIVKAGEAAGADLIFFETYTDLYELKAALLAAKENTHLPILASMSFEAGGRTFTGCTVESFAATARGLGADAVGINCSLGPKEIFPMAKRLAEAVPGNFPVFVKPNAGLPRADGSGYDITPQLFALQMKPYRELHLFAAGGCCGTTPEFIKLLNGTFAGCTPGRPAHRMPSVLCTPVDTVTVDGITVVGERINPTGKKRFQQALREGDMNYVLEQAVSQAEAGAQILDVNVGAPGVDEPVLMEQVVKALQSVTSLPLQLDSSNVEALARGLRVYNGKPIVNSTNGEPEKLAAILPLCKKYGAAIVGLAIDEKGIQPKAADRVAIARRITEAAPDRQRPAGGCAGHGAGTGSLQKGAGSAHRAGRVQHQLWSALPHLPEHHLPDHGHVRRAGPCHHEPLQRGDDGGGVRLQRADQPGQAEHKVHRALCRPRARQHCAGTSCKSRACRQCCRSRAYRPLRCPDESGGKGLEG